ncbi:glycosyltransferase [Kineococcus aurantiacus]|uniref:Tetratricopeptide (TPR) repeat protein n=1 Tax=Kineococcus aurantiacus TaxID=37633 RepID=A0A7Y9DPX1_9ACTN|nr:tetratricopeptide (TPR) repeat protein [Kineococcus aurantiacus]
MTARPARAPFLSAVLIVRDEVHRVGECLDALPGLADEIVVHDTGSTDGTLEELHRRDVVLVEGAWRDDFAAARNTALAAARGEWVLSLDADEVVSADPRALRAHLDSGGPPRRLVTILNEEVPPAGGYSFTAVRLFRRDGARWNGRLHERILHERDPEAEPALVPPAVLSLHHSGYSTPEALRRKGERNAVLARRALDELLVTPGVDPRAVADVALDLGRAHMGAGQLQRAVEVFEAVRDAEADGRSWQRATDYLARLLLGAGQPDLALGLAEQLRARGAGTKHCDWLRAQALAQLRRPGEALEALAHVDQLVDLDGRIRGTEAVRELRSLCREMQLALQRAAGAPVTHRVSPPVQEP